MHKIIFIASTLFIGTLSFSEDRGNEPSLSVGIGAIGSEIGYGVFAGSPYWNNGRTSVQFGYRGNQIKGIPNGGIIQQSYNYSLLDVTVLNRVYRSEAVNANIGITALIGLPSEISSSTSSGMKYSLGAEYQPPEFFATIFSEIGVSWGFNATAGNLQSSPNFLTGLSFLIGLKKYLF